MRTWRYLIAEKPIDHYKKVAQEDIKVYRVGWKNSSNNFVSYYENDTEYVPNILSDKRSLQVKSRYLGEQCNEYWIEDCHFAHLGNEKLNIYGCYPSTIFFCIYDDRKIHGILMGEYTIVNYNNEIPRIPVIGEFIVPKGTIYYENDDSEIASENIIFTGKYLEIKYSNHNDETKDIRLSEYVSK